MVCEVPSTPLFLLSAKREELLWVLDKGRQAFSLTSNFPLSTHGPPPFLMFRCVRDRLGVVGFLFPEKTYGRVLS